MVELRIDILMEVDYNSIAICKCMVKLEGRRNMSKKIHFLAVLLLTAVLFSACGSKTFRCAICMREVKQVPHEVTILGQEVEICDSCYSYLK